MSRAMRKSLRRTNWRSMRQNQRRWGRRLVLKCLCVVPCVLCAHDTAVCPAPREGSPKCRTRFTFRRPTREGAASILCDGDGVLRVSFNHDEVGLTQPIAGSGPFPLCRGYPTKWNLDTGNDGDEETRCSEADVNGWRVLRFRRRVGHGKHCYKRVQEAVFDWDFKAKRGKKSMGIVSTFQPTTLRHKVLGDCDPSGYTPRTPRRRLLATFTELRLPRPLRSVFVANPVHTAYEVKDSKCIPKCLVSASAYATCKGHLLAGEERATVIWRRDSGDVEVEIVSFSRSAPSLAGKLIWPLIGSMQKSFFLAGSSIWTTLPKDEMIL
ncbi:hypothetical protein ACHAXT_006584 [Thalassiosira profunda]